MAVWGDLYGGKGVADEPGAGAASGNAGTQCSQSTGAAAIRVFPGAGLESKRVSIDPNTLYPLLRRLEKQGLLYSEWETGGPKPRKYYRRTLLGDGIYAELKRQWRLMAAGMEELLKEE